MSDPLRHLLLRRFELAARQGYKRLPDGRFWSKKTERPSHLKISGSYLVVRVPNLAKEKQ